MVSAIFFARPRLKMLFSVSITKAGISAFFICLAAFIASSAGFPSSLSKLEKFGTTVTELVGMSELTYEY